MPSSESIVYSLHPCYIKAGGAIPTFRIGILFGWNFIPLFSLQRWAKGWVNFFFCSSGLNLALKSDANLSSLTYKSYLGYSQNDKLTGLSPDQPHLCSAVEVNPVNYKRPTEWLRSFEGPSRKNDYCDIWGGTKFAALHVLSACRSVENVKKIVSPASWQDP